MFASGTHSHAVASTLYCHRSISTIIILFCCCLTLSLQWVFWVDDEKKTW